VGGEHISICSLESNGLLLYTLAESHDTRVTPYESSEKFAPGRPPLNLNLLCRI
jgi:hypothetical protein